MDVLNLIISLISGIVGGNVAGTAMKDKGMGALGNSVTGLLGGGAGGYITQALGLISSVAATAGQAAPAASSGLDLASILANIGGSGVGGAALTVIVALLKNYMQKTS